MKSKLAMLLLLAVTCCSGSPAYAAEQFPDGSIKLTAAEVEQTTRNFHYLIQLAEALKEKVRVLEETKQCKGV